LKVSLLTHRVPGMFTAQVSADVLRLQIRLWSYFRMSGTAAE
jgi:hypothetical protein